jgi:hypothetical protein
MCDELMADPWNRDELMRSPPQHDEEEEEDPEARDNRIVREFYEQRRIPFDPTDYGEPLDVEALAGTRRSRSRTPPLERQPMPPTPQPTPQPVTVELQPTPAPSPQPITVDFSQPTPPSPKPAPTSSSSLSLSESEELPDHPEESEHVIAEDSANDLPESWTLTGACGSGRGAEAAIEEVFDVDETVDYKMAAKKKQ